MSNNEEEERTGLIRGMIKISPATVASQLIQRHFVGALCSKSSDMQTLQHSLDRPIHTAVKQAVPGLSFLNWCEKQEDNHFMWVAFILAIQACVLIPITLLTILVNGSDELALIALLTITAISFITLLAAMPTKYTIPVFVVALLVDVALVAGSLFHLF